MSSSKILVALPLTAWLCTANVSTMQGSQAARPTLTSDIITLDPQFDTIVAPGATIEKVRTGFKERTEGPVWSRDGALIFSELLENTIYKMRPDGQLSVLRSNSGWPGPLIAGV